MATQTFTADDKRLLNQYRGAWAALCERSLIRNPPEQMSVDIFGQEFTDLQGVDEEHLRAFLTALRQFMLDKEKVSFLRICNVLCRGSESPNLRRWVALARERWHRALRSRSGMPVNGQDPTLEEILDLLHYGDIVHRDEDKVAALAAMPEHDRALLRMKALELIWPMRLALGMVDVIALRVLEDRVHEIPEYVEPPAEERRPRGSLGQIVDS
jgi:hypothetical protein